MVSIAWELRAQRVATRKGTEVGDWVMGGNLDVEEVGVGVGWRKSMLRRSQASRPRIWTRWAIWGVEALR